MPKRYDLSDFLREFPNEKAALKYVLQLCPPPVKVYRNKRTLGWVTARGKSYAPLSKTVFKGARLPLDRWFFALFLLHHSKYWKVRDFKKYMDVSSLLTAFRILKKLRPVVNREMGFKENLNKLIRGEKVEGTDVGN